MLQAAQPSRTIAVYTEHTEFDITVTRIVQFPTHQTQQLMIRWLKNEQGDLTGQWSLE
jgi:hypothetical protein